MNTASSSDFKRGMVLMLEGVPHQVDDFHTVGTGKTKHKTHVRLRNLLTGRSAERVFTENERIPVGDVEHQRVLLSYRQGADFVFLNAATFEEVILTGEQISDRHWFLKENQEYPAMFMEGKLMDIQLPAQVSLQVTETGPIQKGGSDSAWKTAKLESGLEIQVPLFIGTGEQVWVDSQTRKYLGKDSGEQKS